MKILTITNHQIKDGKITNEILEKNLTQVTNLDFHSCTNLTELPANFAEIFQNLSKLDLYNCQKLEKLPEKLPKKLAIFNILGCPKLTEFPAGSLQEEMRELEIRDCKNITKITGEFPDSAEKIWISNLPRLKELPKIWPKNLMNLLVEDCPELVDLNLSKLNIGLKTIKIERCDKVKLDRESIERLENFVEYDRLSATLPKTLEEYKIEAGKQNEEPQTAISNSLPAEQLSPTQEESPQR